MKVTLVKASLENRDQEGATITMSLDPCVNTIVGSLLVSSTYIKIRGVSTPIRPHYNHGLKRHRPHEFLVLILDMYDRLNLDTGGKLLHNGDVPMPVIHVRHIVRRDIHHVRRVAWPCCSALICISTSTQETGNTRRSEHWMRCIHTSLSFGKSWGKKEKEEEEMPNSAHRLSGFGGY